MRMHAELRNEDSRGAILRRKPAFAHAVSASVENGERGGAEAKADMAVHGRKAIKAGQVR